MNQAHHGKRLDHRGDARLLEECGCGCGERKHRRRHGRTNAQLPEIGEAHVIAISPKGEIYVADSVNSAVQKFVKK